MKASITFHAQGDGRVELKELSSTEWLSITGPDVEIAMFAGHSLEERLAFVSALREAADTWYAWLADEMIRRAVDTSRTDIETLEV